MNAGMTLRQTPPRNATGAVSSIDKQNRAQWGVGVVLLLAILTIVAESTAGMGHAQTAVWVRMALGPRADAGTIEVLNAFLRKGGHLTGFGLLGMIGERAVRVIWKRRGNARERTSGSWFTISMGIVFACSVGICDEVHQSFLPTRHASVSDVVLDTFGALVFLAGSALLSPRSRAEKTRAPVSLIRLPANAV